MRSTGARGASSSYFGEQFSASIFGSSKVGLFENSGWAVGHCSKLENPAVKVRNLPTLATQKSSSRPLVFVLKKKKKNDRDLRIGIDYSFPGLDFTPALTLDAPLVQAAELRVHGLLGPHVEPLDEADLRSEVNNFE